ncbi:DNA gyrase subunit A, partial [mine drainage metagenome]
PIGDRLADVCLTDGNTELFVASSKGRAVHFSEKQLRPTGRIASGVRGIRLAHDDFAIGVVPVKAGGGIVAITEKGYGKFTDIAKYKMQNRGGRGVRNLRVSDKVGNVVRVLAATDEENILLVSSEGISIELKVSSIRRTGRNASGVRLMALSGKTKVVDGRIM